MKIKASQIKPGMLIEIERDSYWDTVLVLTIKVAGGIEYQYLDLHEAYGGALNGFLEAEEEIKVVTGKERKRLIGIIKKEVYQTRREVDHLIDMIVLIQAMEE